MKSESSDNAVPGYEHPKTIQEDLPPGVVLRDHVYDGIQEYDQRLPNWWLWTLYITIIFSFVYWFMYYTGRAIPSDEERIAREMQRIEALRFEQMGTVDAETLWQLSRNPNVTSQGARVYASNCAACHGANLEGGIGQRLNDGEWRWGHDPMDIYSMVDMGSPDPMAGMQAWGRQLGPRQVAAVVAYVLSHNDPGNMFTTADSPGRASER